MLTLNQTQFLGAPRPPGPIRVYVNSPTIDGASARVELSRGSYSDAIQALAWVATRGAQESCAKAVEEGATLDDVELKWELQDGLITGTLWLHLAQLSDFEKAVASIASKQSLDLLAQTLCAQHEVE